MVLYLGRIVEMADRNTIFEDARHPYTRSLISAVPVPDPRVERSRKRLKLAGDLPSVTDPRAPLRFLPSRIDAGDLGYRPKLEEVGPGHWVAETRCHRRHRDRHCRRSGNRLIPCLGPDQGRPREPAIAAKLCTIAQLLCQLAGVLRVSTRLARNPDQIPQQTVSQNTSNWPETGPPLPHCPPRAFPV